VLVVYLEPLRVELYTDGVLQITANERNMLHYEHQQDPATRRLSGSVDSDGVAGLSDEERHGGKTVVDYGEDGLAIYEDGSVEQKRDLRAEQGVGTGDSWAETFQGHHDSRPLGPMSVGMDLAFPFAGHVYGLPEHTSPLSLPTTKRGSAGNDAPDPRYSEPYRLYSLDVFEYELDNSMALYGHVPFLLAHGLVKGKGMSAGIFWFNPSETFVDISDGGSAGALYKESHWLSETGNLDFFLFSGPNPAAIHKQFTALTGTQQLPPMFALGYHQCRWNYRDEKDVETVESKFEELDYPMDVIWLDIEHTEGKRYFTWDKTVFPTPLEMQKKVSAHGRKMVTIVDPHIKRDNDWTVHQEATRLGLYVKNKDNGDFDGWCWPGSSSYLDFTAPHVRDWWAGRFALDQYDGSTMDLHTWNDMNEPSVFNGPEVSMPKDAKNIEGVEHRYWHNLYGRYMHEATAQGLVQRSPPSGALQRPFVLTRSFWAGSQRFGAMWTGDNTASWEHLKIAAPMLLSINLGGFSFSGADVGGFFGEPSAELFTRWYQAGAFTPFFRGHAHHDTQRREPWVHGEPHTSIRRATAMQRYSLLPYWYSTFREAQTTGLPVMRTMFTEFPDDPNTFSLQEQWMVGSALLVKPVTDPEVTHMSVYIPADSGPWYELETLEETPRSSGPMVEIHAPLEKIPVLLRGGSILPRKMRLRRSASLMFYDPLTLVVAQDAAGNANGMVYMDDETSLLHLETPTTATAGKNFIERALSLSLQGTVLTCSQLHEDEPAPAYRPRNTVERIILAGRSHAPSKVELHVGTHVNRELKFTYDRVKRVLTIKKPDVLIADDWIIHIN
jgi:alpha 1,3-glucosidase